MNTEQNILIIINDGPYGNERAYNGLRLGSNLVKRAEPKQRCASFSLATA